MSETCPTFIVSGDEIVEVGFTEWDETAPGEWDVVKNAGINIPSEADRIIFELPVGCFEMEWGLDVGTLTIGPPGRNKSDVSLSECRNKPARFAETTDPTVKVEG